MKLKDAIKELRNSSKKRKFNQTIDLVINLKEMDINKADNKIDEIFKLPKGLGKPTRITIFHSENIKTDYKVLKQSDIEALEKNKKELKRLIKETDIFLAEPKLMPVVGKYLGKYLAPRGLMPKPLIGDVSNAIKSFEGGVKIAIKKSPCIQTIVGVESMNDNDIEENINAVIDHVIHKLPRGKSNIKNVSVKFTMSKPVKFEV
ncbi:MAG: 50S ribosomal protein L1 [Candidatus Aenigmarchaeota archaeon]|nr:50S ribosomal protein L1 [Candidatus Aenigmarchaeota archaeon]